MAFGSKATVARMHGTGRRHKLRRRPRGRRNRGNYVGLAIGAGIGIALFAILFLTAPKHESNESGEEHASGQATNAVGSRSPFLHE
jgi:hypothetical protein